MMSSISNDVIIKTQVPAEIVDNRKVRLGGTYPSLPLVRIPPAEVADNRKVRLGGTCPAT
jgi:hypothetical protein